MDIVNVTQQQVFRDVIFVVKYKNICINAVIL
jgi:hypothetical protein